MAFALYKITCNAVTYQNTIIKLWLLEQGKIAWHLIYINGYIVIIFTLICLKVKFRIKITTLWYIVILYPKICIDYLLCVEQIMGVKNTNIIKIDSYSVGRVKK